MKAKIGHLLGHLNTTDTALVVHIASHALCNIQSFAKSYTELKVYITEFDEDGELGDDIADIQDECALVALIAQSTQRLKVLCRCSWAS